MTFINYNCLLHNHILDVWQWGWTGWFEHHLVPIKRRRQGRQGSRGGDSAWKGIKIINTDCDQLSHNTLNFYIY